MYRRMLKAVGFGDSWLESDGYSVYLLSISLSLFSYSHRKVSKHWVPMLFLLNLHWQAALMLFYVFIWLFLVSTATDCTWWQAIGCYNVILGRIFFFSFFFFVIFLLLCTVIWCFCRLSIKICNVIRVLQRLQSAMGDDDMMLPSGLTCLWH